MGALGERPEREDRAEEGAGEGPAVVDGLVGGAAARARGGAPREEGREEVVLAPHAQRQQRVPAPVQVGARVGRWGEVDGERPARRGRGGGLRASVREARRGGGQEREDEPGGSHAWVGLRTLVAGLTWPECFIYRLRRSLARSFDRFACDDE